jgi:predicted MFS family arabinose efflux permease
VFPLSAPADFGIGKAMVGNLFLFRGLASTVMLAALGLCTWWHFRGWQLAAGHVLFAAVMVWMARAGSTVAAGAALAAIGILVAHSYSNSLFHGVAGARARAPRMAVHEGLLSAGLVLGSACGGFVFDHWGVQAVYLGCAGVLAAVALAEILLFGRLRRRGVDIRPADG